VPSKSADAPSPRSRAVARLPIAHSAILVRAVGILAIVAGSLLLLSLLQINTGGLMERISALLMQACGAFGTALLALLTIAFGVTLSLDRPPAPSRVIAVEIAWFAFLPAMHSLSLHDAPFAVARNGDGGGAIGWVLAELLWRALGIDGAAGLSFGRAATSLLWLAIFAGTASIAARPYVGDLRRDFSAFLRRLQGDESSGAEPTTTTPAAPRPAGHAVHAADARPIRGRQLIFKNAPPSEAPRPQPAPITVRSQAVITSDDEAPAPAKAERRTYVPRPEALPPLDLLTRVKITQSSDADVRRQAEVIETTLAQFGLAGKVVEIRRGPAVTQFGVEPGYLDKPTANSDGRRQKVRVGQIAALQNDFALALSAAPIRIEAPIPGRSLVGIEVPNASITAVDLRSLMESEAFRKVTEKSPLAFGLGKDVSGQPMCTDLARMPHLLIAGTTGSGKSICISAITMSLVMNNRPEDLKLVMIDPKRVELSRFAGLPHIIGKPESEPDRLPAVLKWAVSEMERRYKRFAEIGARNLGEFNDSMKARSEEPLPHIVILIDELADMMMQSPVETEKQICRLAQMARATGMHMVVATQRPSVDVVTGLIKANFPARMSFAVASSADSRVILDQTGAESLLGRGDMLFMNPESGQPQRIQGCYVSEKDVEAVIEWWRGTMQSEEIQSDSDSDSDSDGDGEEWVAHRRPESETPWDTLVAQLAAERIAGVRGSSATGDDEDDDGDDKLIQQALEIIQKHGSSISASFLQRKLRIGYPRAARLMEDLQALGHVEARPSPTRPKSSED
jgi:S-DNA-T family DNA segregation ATPase FtsK/SpoIIIE